MSNYVRKKKMDNFMCLFEFECAKRLRAHSQAIPDAISWKPTIHVFLPWYFIPHVFCYIFQHIMFTTSWFPLSIQTLIVTSQDVAYSTPVVDHITLSCLDDLLNCVHVAEHSQVFNSMIWLIDWFFISGFQRSMAYQAGLLKVHIQHTGFNS